MKPSMIKSYLTSLLLKIFLPPPEINLCLWIIFQNEGFRQHNLQPKPPQQQRPVAVPQQPPVQQHQPQPPKVDKPAPQLDRSVKSEPTTQTVKRPEPVKSDPPRFKYEQPGKKKPAVFVQLQ